MFHMEQVGTYSESTLRNLQPEIGFSETIDRPLTSFRTGEPVEIQTLKINGLGRIRTGDLRLVKATS